MEQDPYEVSWFVEDDGDEKSLVYREKRYYGCSDYDEDGHKVATMESEMCWQIATAMNACDGLDDYDLSPGCVQKWKSERDAAESVLAALREACKTAIGRMNMIAPFNLYEIQKKYLDDSTAIIRRALFAQGQDHSEQVLDMVDTTRSGRVDELAEEWEVVTGPPAARAYEKGRADERRDVINWLDRDDEACRERQELNKIYWGGGSTTNDDNSLYNCIRRGDHLPPAEPSKDGDPIDFSSWSAFFDDWEYNGEKWVCLSGREYVMRDGAPVPVIEPSKEGKEK